MTKSFDRRSVLKMGGGLLAASAFQPQNAFAQAAGINYWHTFTSQSEFAGLEAVMGLFAKAHPDVAVTQENIPNPEFMAKITAAVVSGSRPNVTMVSSERFADLLAMDALTDLTDRIASWERRSDFDDKRFASITKDGKVYGVPAFTFVDWMYYRKDWFEEAGIAPPTTLEELRTAAIALTDPAKGRFGLGMRGGPGGQNYINNVIEAFGSPVQQGDQIGLNRDKAIEAIDWFSGLLTRDHAVPPSAPNDGFRQVVEGFQTGQTAMIWHHTGSFQDIASALKPGEQFGTLAMPAGPATRVARLAYAYNTLTNSEKNPDASWEWIKFWGEPDAAVAFLEKTGYFPASNTAAQDQRIVGNPLYKPAADTLGFGIPQPSFPGYAGWSESVVLPAFQRVLIGDATPEQAVDEMIDGLAAAVS